MSNNKTLRTLLVILLVLSFSTTLFAQRQKRTDETPASTGPAKTRIEADAVKTDSKSMQMRDESIKQLNELIKDYPEGPRKAEIYRRLAELYWEKARGIKAVIMDEYNKKIDKYYEMNDPNAPMPELNLDQSLEWNKKAIEICDYIIKKYPTFQNLDEVYFFMASNLMETGQSLAAVRYYTLVVEKFNNSKFASDAYFEMGEYFFNNNNVFKAIPNYKAIIDKYPDNKFYGFALYKYAWCMYNVGEYEQSVKLFQQVVEVADKINDQSLKEDALNDMVAPYAESGSVDQAEKYFKTIVKEQKYFIAVLKRLAQIYFDQDRSEEAIKIYRKLQEEAPERPEGPTWQKQIVECYKKLNNKDAVRKEIIVLVANYADANSRWVKANANDEATLESAQQTSEAALRILTVDYHNEARKTKSPETWKIVGELYPTYLKYFPKSEASYDMRFNYAEYLYDHKKYTEAGDQYQAVADMNPKGHHFEDASYGAVSCFGALLEAEQEKAKKEAQNRIAKAKQEKSGEISADLVKAADDKDADKKDRVADENKEKPIPELHQKFITACDTYIKNIPRSKYLVDIIYKQAITYYVFNHFEKAVPVFEMIVQKYPRHELAEFSADLIMDSLNMARDWEAINNKSREFLKNSALLSGRNRLKADLEKFKEMATFYAADIPHKNGKSLDSADRYMAFVNEFQKSKFNDVAMYNAIVYYQKGGDLYKSIRVQEQFLRESDDVYKKSPHRDKIMFGLAKNYEAIAYYDKAAQLYIDFVEKSPNSKDSGDAVYNAAVLYESLGETEKAIDNYRLFVEKYAKDDKEKAEIALRYGYIWMRKGKSFYDKAEKGFDRFVSEHTVINGLKDYYYIDDAGKRKPVDSVNKISVEKGEPNTLLALYGAKMKMYKEQGNTKEYYKSVDKILQISRGAEFKEKAELGENSRDIIAEALLEELIPEYNEYMSIKFDNIPFAKKHKGYELLQLGFDVEDGKIIHHGDANPDELYPDEKANLKAAAKVKDEFNKVSQERMTKKIELTVSLSQKYEQIIEITASPRFTPAVLYYIGKIYKDLTDQMFNAPIAPWLSEAQISEYKNYLDEKAFGAQKNAVTYFETAMKKGYESSVYNEWVAKAKYELRFFQEVTGGKYYDENEIVPQSDMIETSSLIGKIDTNFNFPKISDEERAKLKKSINHSNQQQAQPAAAEAPAESAGQEQSAEPKDENVESNEEEGE
ncbi:tetratricopeptide repeat protein [bacterium]|nr:tetratricopeptide repeat protein [bacterium]